jgi:transcriptional regulator with GAF, ATPase, and Fis domain
MKDTLEHTAEDAPPKTVAVQPGLLLVWAAGKPRSLAIRIPPTEELVLGRDFMAREFPDLPDGHMSRQHTAVRFTGGVFEVRDLGSRNGTFVDGVRIDQPAAEGLVLRIGESLFLFCADLGRFQSGTTVEKNGFVVGPMLRQRLNQISLAAEHSLVLHMSGETGAGKELAARHFHEASPRRASAFVAVNCAAIPVGLAERLLFGAKKGAYSGADADVSGYVQAADGGTLFLDEVGELDPLIQAKLLRVLETHEVLPLGASKPRAVSFALVSATHADLRNRIAEGKFREDLYFRIGRPTVALPPLRERREEIPFLIEKALAEFERSSAHYTLVEAALTRYWPGNVRELLVELRSAVLAARATGNEVARAAHLGDNAGTSLREPAAPPRAEEVDDAEPVVPAWRGITRKRIEDTLTRECGNISAAARALGVHRNQLRRLMARFNIPSP